MCLNLNLKPKYDLKMDQNFVLHIFELHRYAWFHVRTWSIFGLEKVIFYQNCRIKKTRQKVVLQIFWWVEIVSMDPKCYVKSSRDHFGYSYIFLKLIFDCFLSTSLVKTVDIKAWFIQLMSTILPKFLLNINNHI